MNIRQTLEVADVEKTAMWLAIELGLRGYTSRTLVEGRDRVVVADDDQAIRITPVRRRQEGLTR